MSSFLITLFFVFLLFQITLFIMHKVLPLLIPRAHNCCILCVQNKNEKILNTSHLAENKKRLEFFCCSLHDESEDSGKNNTCRYIFIQPCRIQIHLRTIHFGWVQCVWRPRLLLFLPGGTPFQQDESGVIDFAGGRMAGSPLAYLCVGVYQCGGNLAWIPVCFTVHVCVWECGAM